MLISARSVVTAAARASARASALRGRRCARVCAAIGGRRRLRTACSRTRASVSCLPVTGWTCLVGVWFYRPNCLQLPRRILLSAQRPGRVRGRRCLARWAGGSPARLRGGRAERERREPWPRTMARAPAFRVQERGHPLHQDARALTTSGTSLRSHLVRAIRPRTKRSTIVSVDTDRSPVTHLP